MSILDSNIVGNTNDFVQNSKFWIFIHCDCVRIHPIDEKQCLEYYKENKGFKGNDFKRLLDEKGDDIMCVIGSIQDGYTVYIQEVHSLDVVRAEKEADLFGNYYGNEDKCCKASYSADKIRCGGFGVPRCQGLNDAVVRTTTPMMTMVCEVNAEVFDIEKIFIHSFEKITFDNVPLKVINYEMGILDVELYYNGKLVRKKTIY